MNSYDLIILGTGAMGAAAAMHAARRSLRVLALDRDAIPNAVSSHHGVTRFFRMSTFEHPAYVPLLREARIAWDVLSEESGHDLFQRTGMLLAGSPAVASVNSSIQTCVDNAIEHEVLTAGDMRDRFPIFSPPGDYHALWEPGAGCIACERAISCMADDARAHGATLLEHTLVRSWAASPAGVSVNTTRGTFHAAAVILTAGPWMRDFLRADIELTVTRQVQFWLEPPRDHPATPPDLPVWAFDEPSGFTFGFPLVHGDEGCKTCRHDAGFSTSADSLDRIASDSDLAPIRAFLARVAPALDTPLQRASVCMYTSSPDGVFIIDRRPDNVAFACGFTGHGFKFAPVIGRALVDLAIEGRTDVPLRPFGMARFSDC